MLVINYFGGPGAGKSTAATGTTSVFKECQLHAEYVSEFAKSLIYDGAAHLLEQQNYVFANQEHKLRVLSKHADIAISDSPLPLSAFYAPDDFPASFGPFVLDVFKGYKNVNYFIERNHDLPYQQEGRIHTALESDSIAQAMMDMLDREGVPFTRIAAGPGIPERVLADLARRRIIEIPENGIDRAIELIERADQYAEALSSAPSISAPSARAGARLAR